MSLKRIPGLGKSGTSRSFAAILALKSAVRTGARSAKDGERIRQRRRRVLGNVVDRADRSARGSDFKCPAQSLERRRLATSGDLDTAVRTIGHPATEPQASRLLAHEPPKADALHSAAHTYVQCHDYSCS